MIILTFPCPEVTPDPWHDVVRVLDDVGLLRRLSRSRCLLFSPGGPVWYLGERVGSLHLSQNREGFPVPTTPPRSMLSAALIREELLNVDGEIARLVSETLDRFVCGVSYEAHVASLAPPPRLDPDNVSDFVFASCFYLFLDCLGLLC